MTISPGVADVLLPHLQEDAAQDPAGAREAARLHSWPLAQSLSSLFLTFLCSLLSFVLCSLWALAAGARGLHGQRAGGAGPGGRRRAALPGAARGGGGAQAGPAPLEAAHHTGGPGGALQVRAQRGQQRLHNQQGQLWTACLRPSVCQDRRSAAVAHPQSVAACFPAWLCPRPMRAVPSPRPSSRASSTSATTPRYLRP